MRFRFRSSSRYEPRPTRETALVSCPMTSAGTIRLAVNGPRADIRLDRPDVLNAVNFETFEALAATVRTVAESDARVCVLSGAGRSFCSGIDVSDLGTRAGSPRELIDVAQEGFKLLTSLPIPTIARVHGHALGAGLQLAIACDIRVVASDARLGLLEVQYGIIPDLGGSTGLPGLIGPARAKKMIWTREQISGTEAERIGLAEVVVPAGDLDRTTDALVEVIVEAPSVPVKEAKRLVDGASSGTRREGFDAEAEAQSRCMTDPGFADALALGVQRAMSKRSH